MEMAFDNESSFSCDTSMFHAADLRLYADLIDEMAMKQARGKQRSRKSRIMKKRCDEQLYFIPVESGLELKNQKYHLNDDLDMTNPQLSGVFTYFDEDVTDNLVQEADDSTTKERNDSLAPEDSGINSTYSKYIDDSNHFLDCFNAVSTYFDEDVNITDHEDTPDILDETPMKLSNEIETGVERFQCKVTDVIYKSTDNFPQTKTRNCGRLKGMIELFENLDISMPEKSINDSSICITENTNVSNSRVKDIVHQYNQKINDIQEGSVEYRSKRELPSSQPPGKFEMLREHLEKFFFENAPKTPVDNELDKENMKINPYNDKDIGMDNLFVKYNQLKAVKSILQTQQVLQQCHKVCSKMNNKLLNGLENTICQHEENMYKYIHALPPPENELQKSHDNNTALSEHQLRVQASLQRLNIPDWYKQYSSTNKDTSGGVSGAYVPGSFTKKRANDSGRWAGLNSKTTSLSSLGSHRSDRSPLLLSPSSHSHHGQTGFSRWSTSHLNSSQTSPSASARGSFSRGGTPNSSIMSGQSVGYPLGQNSIRSSFRQPYMGWRSQEKLSQPRTPSERLASSLLARQQSKQSQQQQQQPEPAVTPEIQSSIKEVTSAIVHYVNDQTNRTSNSRSRSTSPTTRKCWLESSFVGNRPLDTPQTPVIENSFSPRGSSENTAALARINGIATPIPVLSVQPSDRPSPSSTTLEDVLASLLGLPADGHDRSSDGTTANTDTHQPGSHLQIESNPSRRHSEGDAQRRAGDSTSHLQQPTGQIRRISLDSSDSKVDTETIKCRYPKCDSTATPTDAKKNYKSCHNCSHMYCSRECRRSHWEKHRKACLHSRVSALCRQVLSACKDDNDTLRHLSLLARKGFLSQGRGVVRILFRSPEGAEQFVRQGFQCIGEASYVRWPELMPQEMGAELYSELLRLSTEYKTDSKMLIYVAICVVSETPGSAAAPVKWERQLVSRCAKLKLSKAITSEIGHHIPAMPIRNDQNMDILILTFCTAKRNTLKNRELIFANILNVLKQRGVNMRKHFPDVFQRLGTFVEGTNDRFLPVTIHPRDTVTGRAFICIIMPNTDESDKIKLPDGNMEQNIQIIDCLETTEQ